MEQDTTSPFYNQEFHLFRPTKKGGVWCYGESVTGGNWLNAILNDSPIAKSDAPGIVMNRFADGRRTIKNILANKGFYCFDIDGANEFAALCKKLLFSIPEICLVWISPSGNGVKAIGYFPEYANILDPLEYQRAYTRICQYINSQVYPRINFDPAQGVITQPIFFSSDPNALHK